MIAVVFLAFAVSPVFFMKQIAIGMAVGVLIDATIVRALLVPALMRLLGRLELVGAGARCAGCTGGLGSRRARVIPPGSARLRPGASVGRLVRRGPRNAPVPVGGALNGVIAPLSAQQIS